MADVGRASSPRIVAAVAPSDPPPAPEAMTTVSIEAKGSVDGGGAASFPEGRCDGDAPEAKVAAEPTTREPGEPAAAEDVAAEPTTREPSEPAVAEDVAAATTSEPERRVSSLGDLAVETFFSEGDVSRVLASDARPAIEGDALTIPDKAKRKAEPHVVARRARFVRYVTWAVAGAAVLCLAAVVRMTVTTKAIPAATRAAVVAPPAPELKAAIQAAAPFTPPELTSATPSAEPEPGAVEVESPVAEPEPSAAKVESAGDAKGEKAKARALLEARRTAAAIEAAERSVKLDPTDGESWLILGAAYQDKGNMPEARRAYASCLNEGKTGPRHECAKMLR